MSSHLDITLWEPYFWGPSSSRGVASLLQKLCDLDFSLNLTSTAVVSSGLEVAGQSLIGDIPHVEQDQLN